MHAGIRAFPEGFDDFAYCGRPLRALHSADRPHLRTIDCRDVSPCSLPYDIANT